MKDLTDKTKWSLKDLKTLARPTDRSHRVTVELLFDGRKVGYAHNPGNGCATVVSLKVQDVKLPSQADMVSLVDDLVEREVALRNLTRRHKSLMQQILSGYVYVLYVDKLKAWEAGEAQQESPEPQFSVFRCGDQAPSRSRVLHIHGRQLCGALGDVGPLRPDLARPA